MARRPSVRHVGSQRPPDRRRMFSRRRGWGRRTGSPSSRPRPQKPRRSPTGHDDERGDHPEHPVRPLGVREDVAVERPRARCVAIDDDVPALAGVDPERVAGERGRAKGIAVARDDPHRRPVQMPRMGHRPLVHEPDDDRVAEVRDDRSGGRETAAVDGEPAKHVVADPDDVLLGPIDLVVSVGLGLGLDDERAEEAATDLVGRVVVRVATCASRRTSP